MINNYKILESDENNIDDIELCNIDTFQENELTNTNQNSYRENCSICLEKNDNTSVKLNCGCKNKFHSKCIEQLNNHNHLNKCPVCRKQIKNKIKENDVRYKIFYECKQIFLILLFAIFIMIYMSTLLLSLIIEPIMLIDDSIKGLNYCDNYYKKCDYYQAKGILINNTIIQKIEIHNFDLNYELLSSYQYFDTNNNQTFICKNVESHKFITYDEAKIISKKTIGLEKNIFVPFVNNGKNINIDNCKLNYILYDPYNLKLNISVILNLIWIVPTIFILYVLYILEHDDRQNINKYLKFTIKLFGILIIIIHIILQLLYLYYFIVSKFIKV